MGVLDRVYRIERMLRQGRAVSMARLCEELEVSRPTVKRDLDFLRDRLNAPVVWDRAARGYRLDGGASIPGLYLSAPEIQSLLILHHLVSRIQPALLGPDAAALRALLGKLLGETQQSPGELAGRIRILQIGKRPVSAEHFQAVSSALLARQRLDLRYYTRTRDQETRREVSPQRLVYYRDNWYLDAWCHWKNGLRSFALDAIREVAAVAAPAIEIAAEELDRELGSGYGIFSGAATKRAVLRFSPELARWVSQETWHSEQCGRFETGGCYVLEVPYAGDVELLMDILRYGPDVEVLEPQELREKVAARLRAALELYA